MGEVSEGKSMRTGQVGTVGGRDKRERRRSTMWQKMALVAMMLVPVLLTNGCAGLVGSKSQTSGTASFTVSPTTINFGKVTAGQKSTQNLTLTNNGNMAVTIQQVTSSSAQFGVSGVTLPMTMSAGQSTTLSVWVNGTTSGTVSGNADDPG